MRAPAPTSATASAQARWRSAFLPNYGTPSLVLERGSGCEVIDVEGRAYLDFVSGIAVSSLGHAHPSLTAAVSEQMQRIAHTSNLYVNEPALRLAERLQLMVPEPSKVFFCQDGATAMEAALKLVRRWASSQLSHRDSPKPRMRHRVVAAQDSFHGRTFGALAVTGSPGKRDPFEPFAHDVTFVPFGDADALAAAVDDTVAAIVLEPIQGEAGVVVPPPGYLAAARNIADNAGCLLIVDEVQSGIGRTGAWLRSVDEGVVPDVLTLAKGLAGGLPLGAVLATGPVMTAFGPGDHGSTFGGNPVSCAAAHAVLDTIEREGLLVSVRAWGEEFAAAVQALAHPLIVGTRGVGVWHAIVLTEPVSGSLEAGLRDRGVLVNAVRPDVLRICPPLVVTAQHLRTFVGALDDVLTPWKEASDATTN